MTIDQNQLPSYYTADSTARETRPHPLPVASVHQWSTPEGYIADENLVAAVNVAITLGRPLLLTGEPGTGKSGLAHSVAEKLGLGKPLEFVVKSDTESRDLFYTFDAVGRFHAPKEISLETEPEKSPGPPPSSKPPREPQMEIVATRAP